MEPQRPSFHPVHPGPASVQGDLSVDVGDLGMDVDDPSHTPFSLTLDLLSHLPLRTTPSTSSSLEVLCF